MDTGEDLGEDPTTECVRLINEHLDRFYDSLPTTVSEHGGVSGQLNRTAEIYEAILDAQPHYREARKWYIVAKRSGTIQGDDIEQEMDKIEQLLAAAESAKTPTETVADIISNIESNPGVESEAGTSGAKPSSPPANGGGMNQPEAETDGGPGVGQEDTMAAGGDRPIEPVETGEQGGGQVNNSKAESGSKGANEASEEEKSEDDKNENDETDGEFALGNGTRRSSQSGLPANETSKSGSVNGTETDNGSDSESPRELQRENPAKLAVRVSKPSEYQY